MMNILIIACMTLTMSVHAAPDSLVLREDNIDQIIGALTLEEKAALVVGTNSKAFDGIGHTSLLVPGAAGTTHPIPRLGIPAIVMADGPAGVRIDGQVCTRFPIGTLLAATWNPSIVEEVGEAMGNEVLEFGVDVLLAPGVNIQRNPLCGRNFEYYSEDPVLAGEIGAAMVNGIESNGVGTSVKHFAVNNQEINRLANDSRLSERALREIYLRQFERIVKKSQPWTIMTSYNFINGVHASESEELLTDILRGEWGFEGLVMTDWGGGYDAVKQMKAGNDMIQPGNDKSYADIIDAVKTGKLQEVELDVNVRRVLELIVRSPRFRHYEYGSAPDLKAHADVTRRAAAEGMVLLKNSGAALPMKAGETVALFGVGSYDFIAGGTGSGNVNNPNVVDLRKGLCNAGYTMDKELDDFYVEYMRDEVRRCRRINGKSPGWYVDIERPLEVVPSERIASAAEKSGLAVVTISRQSGEGKERSLDHSLRLEQGEKELLAEVGRAFHAKGKKVILILNVCGAMELSGWQDAADAIVVCWLPGLEGGNSVADVLSGKENPSGRLPMTFPKRYDDDPSAPNFPLVYSDKPFNYSFYRHFGDGVLRGVVKNIDYTDYEEDVFVGYRHYVTNKVEVAYPFGAGFGYTNFKWGDMKVVGTSDRGWDVSLSVKNIGEVAGRDVVELYVSAPGKDMPKPLRELKAFNKTPLLQPGESCTVNIHVDCLDIASFDEKSSSWKVEKGKYLFSACKDALTPVVSRRVKIL